MAQVRFNLRPNKDKDPHIQLVYRMDSDRKKLVLGTNLHVPEKHWNKNTMRVRETKEYLDYEFINAVLDDWEEAVNEVNKQYILAKKNPSRSQLKNDVLTYMKGNSMSESTPSFTKYFEKVIEIKKKSTVSKATVQIYKNALGHVNMFRRKRLRNAILEFQDLDRSFFLNFINYLKDADMENNTINKILRKVRAVINDAVIQGIEVNMDYKLAECNISYVPQPKIYLSQPEIDQIESLTIEKGSRLDKIRDLFLIGVYTGLRFSDFVRVNEKHLVMIKNGIEIIRIRTRKTKNFISIPLKKKVKNIFSKYDGNPPTISEQNFNKYLKELCKEAGINSIVSRAENGVEVNYEKWEMVSSHICRRSFATNSFKAGVPPKLVMSITGHKTIKQFMAYICLDEEETIELAIQNPFFQ